MAALFAPSKAPLSDVRAWTYAGINLFATPGLGSVWGGRKVAGWGQMLFAIIGFCLGSYYIFEMCFDSVRAAVSETTFTPLPAWWWEWAAVFFGIGWLWSLVTSVSLVLEARTNAGERRREVPPIMAGLPGYLAPGALIEPALPPAMAVALTTVPEWTIKAATLRRTFQFQDFPAAMIFVNEVARLAEVAGHHPDMDIRWNRVTLALTTHDAGGLTEKDFALARQVDLLVRSNE
jgi:4a-hydroxytetrahydrobiopterin dehydratase